jgi:4-diphosphocytidyl-2-C-methyl-D-erythritol kinase
MIVRTMAPAKINWTLEVLGKRADGYHEVRTVLQTIDLFDEVHVESASNLSLSVTGPHAASEDDYALRAARQFGKRTGIEPRVRIHLTKQIPVAAGLGGGSSDAAAVLWALDQIFGSNLPRSELENVASTVGSDVPFFLRGGTALGRGRGDDLTPVPDVKSTYLVLLVPGYAVTDKTKVVYEEVRPEDYTDGSCTETFLDGVRQGGLPADQQLHNALERGAERVFAGIERCRETLLQAGAEAVHMAGAGPALFSAFSNWNDAKTVALKTKTPGAYVSLHRTFRERRLRSIRQVTTPASGR